MLIKILLGLGVLVAVLAIVVAMQPCGVQRRALGHDPRAELAALRLHRDAARARSVVAVHEDGSRAEEHVLGTGVGRRRGLLSWEGGKAGEGRMTVVGAKPNQEVDMKLEFVKPMQATNRAVFTLVPARRRRRHRHLAHGRQQRLRRQGRWAS